MRDTSFLSLSFITVFTEYLTELHLYTGSCPLESTTFNFQGIMDAHQMRFRFSCHPNDYVLVNVVSYETFTVTFTPNNNT